MSIGQKPTLSKPWCFDDANNMLDPGGVNDGGLPASAKSIPRRWLNWILNKVDYATRYLMARGIPDWDADEIYTAFDRVQRLGTTYMARVESTNVDPDGDDGTNWMLWGFTATSFTTKFIELLGVHFPDAFASAFATQFPISMNGLTSGPASGDVAATVGTVSDVFGFTIARHSNSYGMRLIACTVTDCGTPNGYFDILVKGTARMSGGPKIWVQRVADTKPTINPRAYLHTYGADIEGVATDVYRIDFSDSSFANGPHPTVNVFILGTPANA